MTISQGALSLYIVTPAVWGADWAWGLPLIVLTVVIHVLGIGFTYQRAVEVFRRKMNRRHHTALFAVVMSTMVLLATVLHGVEAGAWAAFYQFLGAQPDFKTAMLYSLGAMTTYGHSTLFLEGHWQLMGTIEALSGWLLFGLTAAFLFATIQKCHEIVARDTLSQSESGRHT
jgi:MFS superfamily sulfate permease-like transporter